MRVNNLQRGIAIATLFCVIGMVIGYFARSIIKPKSSKQSCTYRTSYYERMVSAHKTIDMQISDNSVYFIGDSHFQRYLAEGGVNYGIGSDTSEGLLARLPCYQSIKNARKVFIEIGCNDIARGVNCETIIHNICDICCQLPTNAEVIVVSLLPSKNMQDNLCKKTVNAMLCNRLSQTRYRFLDIYKRFEDTNGLLADVFDSGDGVHLSAKGYRLFNYLLMGGKSMRWNIRED